MLKRADTSLAGKICPYCQTPIGLNEMVVVCDKCGMPHHAECWQENGKCTTFGCTGAEGSANADPNITIRRPEPPPPPPLRVLQSPTGQLYCSRCGYIFEPFETECPRCKPAAVRSGGAARSPNVIDMTQTQDVHTDIHRDIRFIQSKSRWNWGAFLQSPLWCLAHGLTGWAVLYLILSLIFPFTIIESIFLGLNGNELALKKRNFSSYEEFERTERYWSYWGLGITGMIVFTLLILINSGVIST